MKVSNLTKKEYHMKICQEFEIEDYSWFSPEIELNIVKKIYSDIKHFDFICKSDEVYLLDKDEANRQIQCLKACLRLLYKHAPKERTAHELLDYFFGFRHSCYITQDECITFSVIAEFII